MDRPSWTVIDGIIEEHSQEREPREPPPTFAGVQREVLDSVFRHNRVEDIFADLRQVIETHEGEKIRAWAQHTLTAMELRSPTSLKVALAAVRKGKTSTLHAALQTELNIATAFCVSGRIKYGGRARILISFPLFSAFSRAEPAMISLQASLRFSLRRPRDDLLGNPLQWRRSMTLM